MVSSVRRFPKIYGMSAMRLDDGIVPEKLAVPQCNFVLIKTGMPGKDFVAGMRAEGVEAGRPAPPLLE